MLLSCCQYTFLFSQDLKISIIGDKYKLVGDTVFLDIDKSSTSAAISVLYSISGTNQPVSIMIKEDASSSINSGLVNFGTNSLPMTENFSHPDYTGRIDINLATVSTLPRKSNFDLVFNWNDMLQPGQCKHKKLVLFIRRQMKNIDWQEDPTNTPKLEIIQYTDFLGINSDRPNGVFQEQLLFKWPIFKSYWKINDKWKLQIFRSILLPNILLNRIDKAKDDSSILMPLGRSAIIDSNTGDTSYLANAVGSFDLIRFANTKIEASINIATIHIGKTRLYLNYDAGLLRNRIYDTISQKSTVARPIYSYLHGWHLYVRSDLDKKTELNIEFELGARKVALQDNFFKQYDIYAFENGTRKEIRFPVRTDNGNSSKAIWYSSVKLTKDWGKESTNYVFFRLKYQWQKGKYNFISQTNPKKFQEESFINHFFQVNMGVSLGLEDLFKKK